LPVEGAVTSASLARAGVVLVQTRRHDQRRQRAIQAGGTSELLMAPFQDAAIRLLEKSSVVLSESVVQKSGESVIGPQERRWISEKACARGVGSKTRRKH